MIELVVSVFIVCATVLAHHAMSIHEKRRADHSDHVNAQTKLLHEDMQRMVSDLESKGYLARMDELRADYSRDIEVLGTLSRKHEERLRKVETARAFGGSV